jgi:hypothetical protein
VQKSRLLEGIRNWEYKEILVCNFKFEYFGRVENGSSEFFIAPKFRTKNYNFLAQTITKNYAIFL